MSVSGLCEVCTTGEIDHTCDRCGRLVCEDHHDETTGLCIECAGEVGGGRDGVPSDEDMPDGVDTYRF